MTDRPGRAVPPSAFRLNLEQQKNRAKDLLRARKAAAQGTTGATLKLADAQLLIARELRFPSWAKLKAHIQSLDRQRAAMDARQPAPDADLKTLHIRCGSDIKNALDEAGFTGDFLEHAIPYCLGPVTRGPDRHELMAHFLVKTFPDARGGLEYETELRGLSEGEQRLHRSAEDYERVVIWMEHDSWDQLVLLRLLSHYANARRPRVLELIVVDEFPGGDRFIGIGQLPAEALRLIWFNRKPITSGQLALGHEGWLALSNDDPRDLASLMRSGTPALPVMARALHRHLRELPSVKNGLSLTQQLVLQILSEGSVTLNQVFHLFNKEREPLPWIGDLGLRDVVDNMLKTTEAPMTRVMPPPGERYFRQQLTITPVGLALLRGERDWHTLQPPPRWVGGVNVRPGIPGWRWNEMKREVVRRE
jgi:hypothetical protein